MNFDSETMPEWFGLPDKESLPSTFSIEYVRSWRSTEDAEPDGPANGGNPVDSKAFRRQVPIQDTFPGRFLRNPFSGRKKGSFSAP
jgi:hypothetical protein